MWSSVAVSVKFSCETWGQDCVYPFRFLSPHDFTVNAQVPRCACGTPPLAQCVGQVPRHRQWGLQGVSVRKPRAAPSQTQQLQLAPSHPAQGTGSHGGSASGKTKLHSSEKWGRREKPLCHTQGREGRRAGGAPVAEKPIVKIMGKQPVLWQTVETPCSSRLLAVAYGEEPRQEGIICQVSDPRDNPQCSSLFPKDCPEAGKVHERLHPVDGTPHWSRGAAWGRSSRGKVL